MCFQSISENKLQDKVVDKAAKAAIRQNFFEGYGAFWRRLVVVNDSVLIYLAPDVLKRVTRSLPLPFTFLSLFMCVNLFLIKCMWRGIVFMSIVFN